MSKQKISFYLEGGGSKCSYQLGFLNYILNDSCFNNHYDIDSLYTISYSSIITFFILLKKFDNIQDLMTSSTLQKSISFYGLEYIPIINKICDILWLLYGIFTHKLFNQDNIEKYLNDALKNSNLLLKNNLSKLYIYVFNITKNKIEIINGEHPLIIDYLLAGISYWLIFPPKFIKKLSSECVCDINICNCKKDNEYCYCNNNNHQFNEYMDVGFLQTIPICLHSRDTIIKCLLLTNEKNKQIFINKGNNLLEYMNSIIDYSSFSYQKLLLEKKIYNDFDYVIHNKSLSDTIEIDSYKINKMINKGTMIAKVFLYHLFQYPINKKIFNF